MGTESKRGPRANLSNRGATQAVDKSDVAQLGPDDDSACEEKLDSNVTGAFEAITSTNQCLSSLRRP